MPRLDKNATLTEAIELISDHDTVAIDGDVFHNVPMALVRELVRQHRKDLTVYTCDHSSIQSDLLIGAGCVKRLYSPYVAFEWLGMAPNYRRAYSTGTTQIIQCDELFIDFGLRAAAAGLPFMPLPTGLEYTDLPKVNPDFRNVRDLSTGEEHLAVPAFEIDVALLHAQLADRVGNVMYLGSCFRGLQMARAAKTVIVSVDRIVEAGQLHGDQKATVLPSFLVDAVVSLPYAAHPCSSHGHYRVDENALKAYLAAAKTPEDFSRYLALVIFGPESHGKYLESQVGNKRLATLAY